MKKKDKVVLLYIVSIGVILLTLPLWGKRSISEIILNRLGFYYLHSNGSMGFYYPLLITFGIIILNSFLLKKIKYQEKLHKKYLLHCFGILYVIRFINRVIEHIF